MSESIRSLDLPAPDTSRRARVASLLVRALLSRLRGGALELNDAHGQHRYGSGDRTARVTVHDQRTYARLVRGGSAALGETYAAGWWDCDDVVELVRVLDRSLAASRRRADRRSRRVAGVRELLPRRAIDSRGSDRANIKAHYDLSNEFFELMLDETMMYSCAYFDAPGVTLAEASTAKIDRLCSKLALGPNDHVVEIGTGWGRFALRAASHYGARVTTTTLSEAQYEYATQRIHDAGLGDRVTVLLSDYRDLSGTYDKLVSIEMIEAIGWRNLDTYFATCSRLIRPEGVMGLQAIVIDDASYERAKTRDDFIKRFIFPGGFLPSLEAMARSITRASDFRILDVEDIGRHYAETLRRWRANLAERADAVASLHLGEGFERLWHFYLTYCEAAFLERHVSDVQIVLARGEWRGPLGHLPGRS